MTFEEWFMALVELGRKKKCTIDKKNPESYREYWDDKYTPEMTIHEEIISKRKSKLLE